ncbi:MAG: sodium/solute symporter [Halobacteriovoraceae bacterium]|nr:sodium/solute symporter [Halobacteriovoraceae bacterium]MCB9094061.1 sodium/solute symporter [Halobacteriovoraceae bacterium]
MENTLALSGLDIGIIAFYFIVIFAFAYAVTDKGRHKDSEEYFLAGKDLGWFLVGSSIFASNIGSEHLVGLAGSGASTGVVVAQFEILACFVLLLLGWFFVPYYLKNSISTMPEFLEKRFSPGARNYLTFISIVSYVLTKISVTIYAGAVVFESIGVPFWIGAGIVVVTTGIYTIIGGLKAVIYTDMVQMIVMLLGSLFITYFGFEYLGGVSELGNTLDASFFSMWKVSSDPDFPWTGILFGAPILGVWYWCTDQYVVQRALSARNITEARRGSLFAGFLKLLPLFIFVFPGMIALALSKKGLFTLPKADLALPTLASHVLPIGFKGFFIAGLLAALMSSLSSVFNSCSTLITYEIFKRRNPNASESKLIQVGRIATTVLVVFGILWIPMMKYVSGELFTYIQSVQAYISPPIAAIFFLGLLWSKINSYGALTALYSGFILGITRLVLEINKGDTTGFLGWFQKTNFLHFALYLFVFTSSLMIIVSLLTQERSKKKKVQINMEIKDDIVRDGKYKFDIGLSVVLVILVLSVWWIFS